jgi:hypothetical protein
MCYFYTAVFTDHYSRCYDSYIWLVVTTSGAHSFGLDNMLEGIHFHFHSFALQVHRGYRLDSAET